MSDHAAAFSPILVVGQSAERLAATRADLTRSRLVNPVLALDTVAHVAGYLDAHPALHEPLADRCDLRAHPLPAIVVTDLALPDGCGLHVVRAFRHHLLLRSTPVIAIADGDGTNDCTAVEAHDLGVSAVLSSHLAGLVLGSVIRDLEMPWSIGAAAELLPA